MSVFSPDFYIDEDAARSAVRLQLLFNLMHLKSGLKVDMIVRKDSDYRVKEFEQRKRVQMGNVGTWIVSREDLIISKLVRDCRAIVESSLPATLIGRERRLAFARRMYCDELPEAALSAFADWADRT